MNNSYYQSSSLSVYGYITVQVVEKRYAVKHRDAEEGPSVRVAISGSQIKFEIPKEGIKLPSGWSLEPLVSPVVRSVFNNC